MKEESLYISYYITHVLKTCRRQYPECHAPLQADTYYITHRNHSHIYLGIYCEAGHYEQYMIYQNAMMATIDAQVNEGGAHV